MATGTNAIATHLEAVNKIGKTITYDYSRCCTKKWLIDNYAARLKTSYLNGYNDLLLVKYSDIVPVDKKPVQSFNYVIEMYSELTMNSVMILYNAVDINVTVVAELRVHGSSYTTSVSFNWNTYLKTNKPNAWIKTKNKISYGVHEVTLNFTTSSLSYWPDERIQPELILTVYYTTSGYDSSSVYEDYTYTSGTLLCLMNGMLTTNIVSQYSVTDEFYPYTTSSDQTATNYKSYSLYGTIDFANSVNYYPVLISRNA